MAKTLRFSGLGAGSGWSGAVAIVLLVSGCVGNPNSVGSLADATGGSSVSSSGAGTGGSVSSGGAGTGGSVSSGGAGTAGTNSALVATAGSENGTVVALPTQSVLASQLPHEGAPSLEQEPYQSFISGINALGLELFQRKAALAESNTVMSPVSLGVALSMAYAGAKGDTATEMGTVLRDPFSTVTYHRAVNRLLIELRSRNLAVPSTSQPGVALSLVDSWFLQRDYPVYIAYVDLLGTQYDAGLRLADFVSDLAGARQSINQYASDATQGKIAELLRPNDLTAQTRAVLVNALYLKASWKEPFAPESTLDKPFVLSTGDTISVATMQADRMVPYLKGSNFQAVKLAYLGDSLGMLVILPSEGEFAAVRSALDESWIRSVDSTLSPVEVRLLLPKFGVTWGTEDFKEELKALGMIQAFQHGVADFSGISPAALPEGLAIEKVLQKAFVGIDEAGTEAAAASAVTLTWKAIPLAMTVNRPFLFSILDASGAVLFVGQVMDPR